MPARSSTHHRNSTTIAFRSCYHGQYLVSPENIFHRWQYSL